jgi:hypothetical protein
MQPVGQPLVTLSDYTSFLFDLAWNAAGSHLVSASADRCIIITNYGLIDQNCNLARRNFRWAEWRRVFPMNRTGFLLAVAGTSLCAGSGTAVTLNEMPHRLE